MSFVLEHQQLFEFGYEYWKEEEIETVLKSQGELIPKVFRVDFILNYDNWNDKSENNERE